ncbi:unnamed protein product [Closterium sp. Yama58-4]|nr:unnamed protein product [Closterium sp. Yama58-4]
MSRMTTRNGGIRNTDTTAGGILDKPKEAPADKKALQPAGSAHEVREVARDLLNASSGGKPLSTDPGVKPDGTGGGTGAILHAAKDATSNIASKGADEEEDDGYLSDDPVERYDAQAKSEVAQRIRFAIVLLIPIAFKTETTRVQATLRALFNVWKKDLNMEIQASTKFQELTAVFLNKKQYWRLQVTFDRARDANFVRKHGIVHTCVDGKRIHLDWQHLVDPAYVKARAADPLLVEVLFKGVDAVITPEMLCDMLVKVKLEKRGHVVDSLPRGEDLIVAGDFNMIEDPVLDKSNRQGVTGDNGRMMQMLAGFHAKDVFRELFPDERQFTFYCKSAKVSSRIDRVLASQSMLHLVTGVKHKKVPKGITDHKFAVRMSLGWRGPRESGGSGGFDKLLRSLSAQLRRYDKEERKRVKLTRGVLEEQVEQLQHKVMADLYDDELRSGLKVQLDGEAPTSFLTALIKSRRARTGIKELVRNGVSHTEARGILEAATCHFREAFDEVPAGGAEPSLEWSPRNMLDEAAVASLSLEWSEQEVKQALKEVANDKSPGRDGLPKELFQRHWELLREPVMKMIGEFIATGRLPEVANEAVTILLCKKGRNENSDWYLLLIDFEKAYDSVRRGFIVETVASWVSRQDLLAEGRKLGIGEGSCDRLSYVGYADDTTLLLEGEQQLKDAGVLLQEYAEVSGLKVNKGKSAVLPIGRNVGQQAPDGMEYKWVGANEVDRLLGVWISPGGEADATWEKAFDRAAGEPSKWSTKYLTTGARVTVINSYVLPIFLFQAQVYPPDDLLWRRVEKLIENFGRELGGSKEAEMALKAFNAAPERWRQWVLAPLTAEEVAAESPVVCTRLPGGQRCLWEICGKIGRKVELRGLSGKGERTPWDVRLVLCCDNVLPVKLSQARAVREAGDPRTRLLSSSLFKEEVVVPVRGLREPSKGVEAVEGKRSSVAPVVNAVKSALSMMQLARRADRLADFVFGEEETKSGIPEATMVAVAMHQVWLGRCDVSLRKLKRFQARKVLMRINVEFNKHARIYCGKPGRRARKDKARWNLAEDEARVMRRICVSEVVGLKWQGGFQSIWSNPRTFVKPL